MEQTETYETHWRALVERTIAALQRANQGEDLAAPTDIIEDFLRESAA